jgi:hypothetical protein
MIKPSSGEGAWWIVDNMRGLSSNSTDAFLSANTSSSEGALNRFVINPTGFSFVPGNTSTTYIYIAIRRGPMKVPTSGTSVFAPFVNGAATTPGYVTSFPPDFCIAGAKSGTDKWYAVDRLRGAFRLNTASTAAETSISGVDFYQNGAFNQDWQYGYNSWVFRRAPGFFDEVCYTGTGSATTQAHNLGVIPELMIIKSRGTAGTNWAVYSLLTPTTYRYNTLQTDSAGTGGRTYGPGGSPNFEELSAQPTSTVINLASSAESNASGRTFVAYLFATLAEVSKVGSYTGNGSSQTINCGFTGGARFVLVKATSTTGNWIVADSARGIVAGNDPALYLNSTATEVTGLDWIDADSTGFVVNETATIAANTSGVSYIFIAVA